MSEVEYKKNRFWKKAALSGAALTLPLLLFQTIGLLQNFESHVIDFMMALRGPRVTHPNLLMVTIDDETGRQLGSPLPQQYYTQTIRALAQYGAKAIVVDAVFKPTRPADAAADSALAALTQQLGNVVHAFYLSAEYDPGPLEAPNATRQDSAYAKYAVHLQEAQKLSFIRADSMILPRPFLLRHFQQAGDISVFPDHDGLYRRVPVFCQYRGKIYPSLNLAALSAYGRASLDSLKITHNFWGYSLVLDNAQTQFKIPINADGQAVLNFDGAFASFKSYSILQILQAVQDLEERNAPRISLHDIAGKIVVIGNNETLAKDYFPTPLAEDFPGMGIHATALNNFLSGTALREWPWYAQVGLTLVLGLLLSAGLAFAGKRHAEHETIYAWLLFGFLITAYNIFAYLFLFKTLHVAPPVLPINSALALLFIASLFYEKSLNVERLNHLVHELASQIATKDSHVQTLNTRLGAQDEQYKAIDFFINEIENVFQAPAAEQSRALETPLMKMQLFKGHLKTELERGRVEKQLFEAEKASLISQIVAYKKILEGVKTKETAPPAPAEPAPEKNPEQLQDVNRVMESYRAFVHKTKTAFYYEPSFEMVAAPPNGRTNGANHAAKTRLQEILAQIARYAPYDSPVLITGETGTGKDLAARAICRQSPRKNAPYVVLNCAAIPDTLIESELFGHVKGAFTGAVSDRAGAFEQADGGVIFLDEIGDLKLELQAKFLRVLQEKKVQRLGSNKLVEVDVRVIAATNRDLQQLMQNEQFRQDLYFRLDVANIHLPPLRERKEDIPHLVHYFIAEFGRKNTCAKQITEEALLAMMMNDWPGNIRELQHVIEKVCINTVSETIRLTDLPDKIQREYGAVSNGREIELWEAVAAATKIEMANLLEKCQELLRAGSVETALQAGALKLWGAEFKDCFDYMKAYIDGKASSFPPEQREKLAKQTIVTMSEQLQHWCREQKLGTMPQNWEKIETLLGRTRRMMDNWRREG